MTWRCDHGCNPNKFCVHLERLMPRTKKTSIKGILIDNPESLGMRAFETPATMSGEERIRMYNQLRAFGLDEQTTDIMMLRFADNMTLREIASYYEMQSHGEANYIINTALGKLRSKLEEAGLEKGFYEPKPKAYSDYT